MKDNLLLLLLSAVTCGPFVYSLNFSLTPKKKSVWFSLAFFAYNVIFLFIKVFVFDNKYGSNGYSSAAIMLFQFSSFLLFSKDSWKTVLKFYLILASSMVLSDIFCMFVFYFFGNNVNGTLKVDTSIRIYSTFILFIFMFAANFFWHKTRNIQIYTKYNHFFIVFSTQVIMGLTFMFYTLYNENSPIKLTTVILFTGVAWIITDLFFIKAVFDNHRKAELKMSLDQAMEMEKMQYEYYENLTESINSLRKYRHDLNNILQTLMMIINNPETLENGRELLEQLCERYDETQLPYYCSNPVINAVILAKTATAEEKGITVDLSVDLENTQMFENIDLCSIFANMLDNALEAASEVENGRIAVSCWSDTGYLFIKCTNSYKGEVRKNGKGFVSTKGKDRGLGLSIIESITKKYGGSFFAECKEEFSALAVLDLKCGEKS